MTIADQWLELRIWWARRQFVRSRGVFEIIKRGDALDALIAKRRPEVAEAIVRRFIAERSKGDGL